MPEAAYISEFFSYHQAFFIYLSDLILFVCFMDWLLFDRKSPPNKRLFAYILALFGLILVTLFHVKQLNLGLYQAFKWLELLTILVYLWSNFKPKDIKVSLIVIFIAAILQSAVGLGQFHAQRPLGLSFLGEFVAPIGTTGLATIDFYGSKITRAYGTMPHPNVLAGFLILGLIAGFYMVSRETTQKDYESRIRLLFVSCGTIVIMLGIAVSFSRIGWIAAFLATAAFLLFHMKRRDWLKVIFIIIVSAVSCGTILIGYRSLLVSRGTENFDSLSITLRTNFNQMGLEIIKKFPVLGVGVGNYIEALKDLRQLEPWQHQPAHNIYIFLAAELGILGLAMFLIIVFGILRFTWNRRGDPLVFSLLLTVILFLLMGLFDHYFITIQQGRLAFFVALGLLAATANQNE